MPQKKIVPKSFRKKVQFRHSKDLILPVYTLITALTVLAWNSYFNADLSGFSIPSLLAMLAFGFMWVHYFARYLKTNFEPDLDTSKETKFTQYFVLLAILLHPLLIILNLRNIGLGLPPASFSSFFGKLGYFFIILGTISLSAFLLFEFKVKLEKKPKIWSAVLKLNDLAMLLIILHGFRLGFIINSSFFRYVWLGYGLTLLYFFFDKYVQKKVIKKFVEVFIISLVLMAMAFISLAVNGKQLTSANDSKPQSTTLGTDSKQKSVAQSNSSNLLRVTKAELSANNGLSGHKCLVAVNGTVYDATGNPKWKNGEHTSSVVPAKCGNDLSELIRQSPHGLRALNELNKVGRLQP